MMKVLSFLWVKQNIMEDVEIVLRPVTSNVAAVRVTIKSAIAIP